MRRTDARWHGAQERAATISKYGRSQLLVWLNPVPEKYWSGTTSIGMIRALMEDRMFPLTLDGIDRAMRALTR